VVKHGKRQSIEMYELKPASGSWALIWQGCVAGAHDYNDVAIPPDGGFVGTYPTGLLSRGNTADQFGDVAMGYVARRIPGKGESEVSGTRVAYRNGVVVSTDARGMFLNVFAAREVRKYDLNSGEVTSSVKVESLPDNLTRTKQGLLLVAGVKGARGDCPEGSGSPCIQGFGVAEINPAQTVFDSAAHDTLITGVSVTFAVGDSIYLGVFQADRLVKIGYQR
jgi:hypothetical protein